MKVDVVKTDYITLENSKEKIFLGDFIGMRSPRSFTEEDDAQQQAYFNAALAARIGEPPYMLQRIHQEGDRNLLDIKGGLGALEYRIHERYFARWTPWSNQ